MRLRNSISLFSLMIMMFAALGCGGFGFSKGSSVTTLIITPSQLAPVPMGGSVQFYSYEGAFAYTNVKWSVSPATSAGSINQSGLYVAPSSSDGVPPTATVTAQDQKGTGIASVTFSFASDPVPVISSATPNSLTPGTTALITLNGSGLGKVSVVNINNEPVSAQVLSDTMISITYNVPGWASSAVSITASSPSPGGSTSEPILIPVTQPAISYDAASRFLQQAAWGPTDATIQHVQSVGFAQYIDEQLASGPDYFYTDDDSGHVAFNLFINGATHDSSQLRVKMAWILWKLYCTQFTTVAWVESAVPDQVNRDAFANFETLLTDTALNPQMGVTLNYDLLDYPTTNPNENFGRESMQLFTTGPVLLNPDGTPQTDVYGNQVPAYSQADVIGISRAVTGFVYPPNYRENGDPHGEQQLQSSDTFPHDEGEKTVLGVTIPGNQTVTQDTTAAMHILASQPNVGPFIGKYLIHELVTSNPSPAYVARITAVWNDDGNGVRGDIPAVVKAILLDPEARAGDDSAQLAENEGRFRDPAQFGVFFYRTLQCIGGQSGGEATGMATISNEMIFAAPSIFSYYQQNTTLPNSTLLAPESQLYTVSALEVRAWFLYQTIYMPAGGDQYLSYFNWPYWESLASGDGSQIIDYINHIIFHGTMSSGLKSLLQADVQQISDPQQRAQKIIFDTFLSPEISLQR